MMYRLLIGFIIAITIELWSGAATVHAVLLDIVVKTKITGTGDDISEGKFLVRNHTHNFFVKGFAVTLGTALTANLGTLRNPDDIPTGWKAEQPTDDNPINGLPGSAGGVGDDKEYVFYHVMPDNRDYYLRPHTKEDRFLFTINDSLRRGSYFFPFGILAEDKDRHEVTCIGSGRAGCQVLPNLTSPLTALGQATLWIGLKNGGDQGTQFDLRAEVYIRGVDTEGNETITLVSEGEKRCIMGVTRNPDNAKEVTIKFGEISDGTFHGGDRLLLEIYTRIGTNRDGTQCSGPGGSLDSAKGLRLYYDAKNRPSRFAVAATSEPRLEPLRDFFLHSTRGENFLDDTEPTARAAQYQDSAGVSFAGADSRWQIIGTWSMPLPGRDYTARD
jgi:hypothetical protein